MQRYGDRKLSGINLRFLRKPLVGSPLVPFGASPRTADPVGMDQVLPCVHVLKTVDKRNVCVGGGSGKQLG